MASAFKTIDDIWDSRYPRAVYYYDHPDGFTGFKTPYGYDWWRWDQRAGGYMKSGSTNGKERAKKKRL